MKIKINKAGCLEIDRKKIMSVVQCPVKPTSFCGDWCALFAEPETEMFYSENRGESLPNGYISISLCKQEYRISAKDFTDER